ncbi:MAG TPA: HYExAFE family protein [Pirellulales bacterium]|jgi:hypothetical protein
MAKRSNHYEAAFEEYLRSRQIPYVAVDEKKRALLGGGSLKSLDFIVSPVVGGSWLVDVKGRRFPAGSGQQKQYWKNWSTRDDVRSLGAWQQLFGAASRALFVFAYEIVGDRAPLAAERLFEYGGRLYAFIGIQLDDYAAAARPLSAKWDTLAMNVARFRELATDVSEFLERASSSSELDWASEFVATDLALVSTGM